MRLVGAAQRDMKHTGRRHVVDILSNPGEKTRILRALDALANQLGAKLDGMIRMFHS
ncbi:hypothetical protein AGR7B_pAt0353 [Agrobacterium deltaense RV3]|nr:hypothetical protein AGR7B_pAt0353 [Agrobacterium deltaense RV3]